MSEISQVSPQKKKKNRLNIYIDGNYSFGADIETVIKFQLKPGKIISQKTILEIVKKEELTRLFDSSLKFLSYRPRSQKEVKQYIIQKISKKEQLKYREASESSLIVEIIKKLKKYKYINDLEFAKWWIESRNKSLPKGQRLIKSELIQKGIDREIIDKVLGNLVNQTELAKQAMNKKIKKWHKLSAIDFKKKTHIYLASRGFDFDTIRETVAKYDQKS